MSELTTCNHCNLERIKSDAKRDGKLVVLVPSTWGMGGFEIYVHPRAINWRSVPKTARRLYWVAWMMKIGDHCEC